MSFRMFYGPELPVDDGHIPLVNRPETVRGVVITFMLIACISVALRLGVRIKERLWGYDDLFVLLAAIAISAGAIVTCLLPNAGMGKHFWTLHEPEIIQFFKHVWSSNVAYTAGTGLIKISILVQYLRLFDKEFRTARILIWSMIVFISCWSLTFFLLAMFSCSPISKNWQFALPGKCVGWGSKVPDVMFSMYAAHGASNMALDILVFLLPLPFLKGLRMNGKTRLGLISLFTVGGIVVSIAVARMIALSEKRCGTVPIFDPTFATPLIYIFSVLEVNIAILCASIPIFWPLVSSLAANKILVVQEIEIRTDRRTSQAIGLAEQGTSEGFEDNGGRQSRMSTLIHCADLKPVRTNSRKGRSNSRSRFGHRQKSSSTSSLTKGMGAGIELGHRISHESQRNLAHQDSSASLSYTSSPGAEQSFDTPRNGSITHYQDRYVQEWACPDFDKKDGDSRGERGHTANVEKAEMPYDHLRALEK